MAEADAVRNELEEDDELCDTDAVVRSIMQRKTDGEFPEVLPVESCSAVEGSTPAEDILSWVRKVEHTKIQSFIDERYADFRASGQVLEGSNELIRAKWARESYYVHLAEYMQAQRANCEVAIDSFEAILPLATLPEEKSDAVFELLRQVGNSRAEACLAHVDAEWAKIWDRIPAIARVSQEVMQRNWLLEELERLLQGFLASCAVYHFEPELGLDALPAGTERTEAAALVARVQPAHAPVISQAVAEAYAALLEEIPAYVRAGTESQIRLNFLTDQYFAIVRRVLESESIPCTPFVFAPAIEVASLATEEARAHAAVVLRNVQQEHVERIEEAVEAAFEAFEASLPPIVSKDLPASVKESWMHEHYFGIVDDVVKSSSPESAAGFAGGAAAPASPVQRASLKRGSPKAAMLQSPQSRQVRPRGNSDRTAHEPVYLSVGEVHQVTSQSAEAHILEAYLLFYPEEPRWVELKDRRTGQPEQVAVATCVLADREGPVLVDFWRDLAQSTLSLFSSWSDETATSSSNPLLIEVKHFVCRPENRKSLTPMRKLVTNERTVITQLGAGTQTTVTEMQEVPPLEALFTRDMNKLQDAAPFVVSVAGIIGLCEEERATQSGRNMRNFHLHDRSGRFVPCSALGRHASNPCIQDGNEVVLYFAQASNPSSPNSLSSLWMYDESHMVVLHENRKPPPQRSRIEFRAWGW